MTQNSFTHPKTSDKNDDTLKNISKTSTKGCCMNVNLELHDSLVRSILEKCLSSPEGLNFNEYVSSVLVDHISSIISDESIMNLAIERVESLNDGQTFTLKELMIDKWESIENPKSFGREFKKRSTHAAQYMGVNSSNKALYKKYTYQAPPYPTISDMVMNANLP